MLGWHGDLRDRAGGLHCAAPKGQGERHPNGGPLRSGWRRSARRCARGGNPPTFPDPMNGYENAGRGEHGGAAAQIGSSAHGAECKAPVLLQTTAQMASPSCAPDRAKGATFRRPDRRPAAKAAESCFGATVEFRLRLQSGAYGLFTGLTSKGRFGSRNYGDRDKGLAPLSLSESR